MNDFGIALGVIDDDPLDLGEWENFWLALWNVNLYWGVEYPLLCRFSYSWSCSSLVDGRIHNVITHAACFFNAVYWDWFTKGVKHGHFVRYFFFPLAQWMWWKLSLQENPMHAKKCILACTWLDDWSQLSFTSFTKREEISPLSKQPKLYCKSTPVSTRWSS